MLLILLVVLLLAAGAAVLAARAEIHGKGRASRTVTVTIEKGSGVAAIADQLKQEGVIRSSLLFRYYVKNTDSASRLQYGTFTLDAGWPYVDLVDALSQYAKAESVRLTFPEGTTAQAIAQKMEQAGLCTAQEFLDEANNGDFSQYRFWQYVPEQVPGRFMKCEGYLFPDTYDFLMEDTVHNYVATFYAHFDAQITEEMYAALEAQEMSLPQLVTLASFVQEEAGNAQDSNVAQVFRNRLAPPPPPAACKAMPPAISRTMQTTIICGTGWRLTMADGIRSPRRSWRHTIPTPWRGCPQAPSPTRALQRSRLPYRRSRTRK